MQTTSVIFNARPLLSAPVPVKSITNPDFASSPSSFSSSSSSSSLLTVHNYNWGRWKKKSIVVSLRAERNRRSIAHDISAKVIGFFWFLISLFRLIFQKKFFTGVGVNYEKE